MKKILALVMALCLVAACCACASAEGTYKIGILQLIQHVALDSASQGFMDALTEKLGAENVEFDYQNASGESANCATIANTFVSNSYDLVMGNATPALQALVEATDTIPVLGTSITDYGTALGIEDWQGVSGINVSGTCDLAPLDGQAAMIKELFPDAKKVGMLFCSAEPNSIYQVTVISAYLSEMGYECVSYPFADSNDIASVAQTACDNADVLYVPTDNTAANNAELIGNVVFAAGTPLIAGEEGICKGCGVATLSINYYDIGYICGEMAADILANGTDVSTMPVKFAPNVTKEYVPAAAELLNVTIPADYVAIGE